MAPAVATPTNDGSSQNSSSIGNGVPRSSTGPISNGSAAAAGKNSTSHHGTPGTRPQNGEPAANRRIDLEKLVIQFQQKLGENWDRYQSALCLFLLGKLSRSELTEELNTVLDKQTTRMHNQLLLANLANALRDGPSVGFSSVGFGGPASKKQKRKTSSQYEKIKKDIMALPPRERRRLKSLQRDSGKKQMATSSLTMTRQELLPKIPMINKNTDHKDDSGAAQNGSQNDIRVNNTALWAQEILQGVSTLNASESFEMPDLDMLSVKMTQMMREHGLIGKMNPEVTKIMSLGLETHLRSVLEAIIDVVKYRRYLYGSDELLKTVSSSSPTSTATNHKKRKNVTVTLEDVFDTLEQQPALVDFGGPSLRLTNSLLKNDDSVEADYDIFNAEWAESAAEATNAGSSVHSAVANETTTATPVSAAPAAASTAAAPAPAQSVNNGSNASTNNTPVISKATPTANATDATVTATATTHDQPSTETSVANKDTPPVVKQENGVAGKTPAPISSAVTQNTDTGTRSEMRALLRDILLSS